MNWVIYSWIPLFPIYINDLPPALLTWEVTFYTDYNDYAFFLSWKLHKDGLFLIKDFSDLCDWVAEFGEFGEFGEDKTRHILLWKNRELEKTVAQSLRNKTR